MEKFPDQLDQGAWSTKVVYLIGIQILDNSRSEEVRLNLPYQMKTTKFDGINVMWRT